MNNISFEVIPDSFKGIEITKYKGVIQNGKSEFYFELSLNNFSLISYNKKCDNQCLFRESKIRI